MKWSYIRDNTVIYIKVNDIPFQQFVHVFDPGVAVLFLHSHEAHQELDVKTFWHYFLQWKVSSGNGFQMEVHLVSNNIEVIWNIGYCCRSCYLMTLCVSHAFFGGHLRCQRNFQSQNSLFQYSNLETLLLMTAKYFWNVWLNS